MLKPSTVVRSRYKIIESIGQGGMGAVYEAEDLVLAGRRCAIKEVRLDPDMTDAARRQAQEQFYREAVDIWRSLGPDFESFDISSCEQTQTPFTSIRKNYAATMWFRTAYLTSSELLVAPSTSIIRYL